MILVTGGAGYIGSHTVLKLLERGFDVAVADNFINSKTKVIERMKKLAKRDFSFYETDVREKDQLDKIFSENKIDLVIHFAGLKAPGESVDKPLEYYANNLDSTIALTCAMNEHGVFKLVFSSSAAVYDLRSDMPLDEASPTGNCANPYGRSKRMCEQILTDAVNANKLRSVALLRYFNPIGAHESGQIGEDPQDTPNNLMPYITQTAVGRRSRLYVYGNDYDTPDGTGVRDYIHVEDLAAGHIAAIEYLENNHGVSVFNLGAGKGVSVMELICAFEKASGVEIKTEFAARRPGDSPICYASVDKAKTLLGWEAKKTIAEACADSWRWQKSNPNGY